MEVTRVEEGLWYWNEPHSASSPQQTLGSVYFEADRFLILVDPILPAKAERDRFWEALDRDIERLDLKPTTLITTPANRRDHKAFETRYAATTIQLWELPAGASLGVPHPEIEQDVEVVHCGLDQERSLWLRRARALVVGRALCGVDGRSLARDVHGARSSSLERADDDIVALAGLEPRHVLTCVGPPVVDHGAAALNAAVGI